MIIWANIWKRHGWEKRLRGWTFDREFGPKTYYRGKWSEISEFRIILYVMSAHNSCAPTGISDSNLGTGESDVNRTVEIWSLWHSRPSCIMCIREQKLGSEFSISWFFKTYFHLYIPVTVSIDYKQKDFLTTSKVTAKSCYSNSRAIQVEKGCEKELIFYRAPLRWDRLWSLYLFRVNFEPRPEKVHKRAWNQAFIWDKSSFKINPWL